MIQDPNRPIETDSGLTVSDSRALADLRLARRVLSGDEASWHEFVQRFAGLIYVAIRRQVRMHDDDEVRTMLVDVFVALRRSKLRTYQGRATLSTWLTIVTRSEVIDALRRRRGRGRHLKVLAGLDTTERLIVRMVHHEGRSAREVLAALNANGRSWTIDGLLATLGDLERRLGHRWVRSAAYDRQALALGAPSGRMLEYLDRVREEQRLEIGSQGPEDELLEREMGRHAERVKEVVAALDPDERRLIELRFVNGRSAREIAREAGLPSPRGVYSATDRIVRKLRRWLGADGGTKP